MMSQYSPKTLMRNAFARRRAALASRGPVRAQLLAQAAAELEDALAQARAAGSGQTDLLVRALLARSEVARDADDKIRARAFLDEAVALRRTAGEPGALAEALQHLAALDLACGARASALDSFAEIIALHRADETAPPRALADALNAQGQVMAKLGERDDARAAWFEAAAIYAQIPDDDGVIACQSQIAALRA